MHKSFNLLEQGEVYKPKGDMVAMFNALWFT